MPLTQRIGSRFVAHRSGVSLRYLLRATFDAPDQGYANGQVLDTVAEGVQDGQLTVVEVDGTLAIVSGKCAFTAQSTPIDGDQGFFSSGAITKRLGITLLSNVNSANMTTEVVYLGFKSAAAITLAAREFTFGKASGENALIYVRFPSTTLALSDTFADSTDYIFAIVLGGYDVNGAPWRAGQVTADYLYGAAYYVKGGAFTNWTLIWRTASSNTTPLYAGMATLTFTGTLDNFRVPDADLSAVLQPTCLSTFATDGELDAYTPELGSAWAEDIGDWDTASGTLKATALGIATFTGLADCLYDAKVTTPAAGTTAGGLALRITDLTGASEDYWYVKVTPGTAGTDWELIEYVAGTPTQRAFGDADWAVNTAYQIRAICYGQTIDCFRAGGGKITYGSAASGQTATKMGLRDEGNANMTFDNVAVFPRTSSIYEAEFGRV